MSCQMSRYLKSLGGHFECEQPRYCYCRKGLRFGNFLNRFLPSHSEIL